MYTTAPDVLNKKMKELNKLIEDKATEKAREKIDEAKTEKELKILEKENNLEDLIRETTKRILKDNEKYVGKDIIDSAIKKVESEEGGNKI